MPVPRNSSGQDETLAAGLYTGPVGRSIPRIHRASFTYTIPSEKKSLLGKVNDVFGSLKIDLPAEHQALLDQDQSPEDIELARRMRQVQAKTL